MLLAVKAFRFSLVNGGHELMSLALKLKQVAHRLAFLAQIMFLQLTGGSRELTVLIAQWMTSIAVINDLKC
jgi:hypothetical protein